MDCHGGSNATRTSQFNIEAIAPYIGGVDFQRREFSQMWACPSNDAQETNSYNEQTWNPGNPNDLNAYVHFQYAYFAQVSKWGNVNGFAVASRPNDLCDTRLAADRVLMADWLYYWGAGVWAYNHGRYGASAFWSAGVAGDPGPPKFTGINKLYADGHVVWDTDFDPRRMHAMVRGGGPDYNLRWVTAGGYSYTWY